MPPNHCKMMTRERILTIVAVVSIAFMSVACGGGSSSAGKMKSAADSLSYVVGMNIAYNIMQMDSTLVPDVVVEGISDALHNRSKLSFEDARNYFLAYMNYDVYDRVRKYEEQYLKDLVASDKDVVRAESRVAYKVESLGDMNNTASMDRDTVAFRYRVTDLSGKEVDPASEREDVLRGSLGVLAHDMEGLSEGLKIVGPGGKLTLWVPSDLAYGSAGDSEKGIAPNSMLRYEIEIVDVVKYRRR